MVSVENFYHVLYNALLKPVNFSMRYFYPFGTYDKLLYCGQHPGHDSSSGRELIMASPLVLFHFDQEPLYLHDQSLIFDATNIYRAKHRYPQILANSEKSDVKKLICRDQQLLDWYYFYHGFAALDWFRDARFMDHDSRVTKCFVSFNHLIRHKRSYRMAITARLINEQITDQGVISFHGTSQDCEQEVIDINSPLSMHSKNIICKNLIRKCVLPMIADTSEINGQSSAAFGHREYATRQSALFTLVNETVFFDKKLHLTEKVFQPIVCARPFLLAAAPGNLAYLRSYGFKTFNDYIDESYDDEIDDDKRMDKIVAEIAKLCARPLSELNEMLADMRPILEYNRQHFFGDFKRIIVDELVDNFNQCLRIWNNGRVDDRQVQLYPDPAAVKQILLR